MDTSVAIGIGDVRVNNLGLMQQQQNTIMLAMFWYCCVVVHALHGK